MMLAGKEEVLKELPASQWKSILMEWLCQREKGSPSLVTSRVGKRLLLQRVFGAGQIFLDCVSIVWIGLELHVF